MNACAISLTRPHEHLVIAQSLWRRVPRGIFFWNTFALVVIFFLTCIYALYAHIAVAKIYTLRKIEKRVEALQTETRTLQDTISMHSSVQAMNARATELGFVPIDHVEFVHSVAGTYALAR